MKMVLIEYATLKNDEPHWNLCLETTEDVEIYTQISHKLSALHFWEVWGSLKKGHNIAHATTHGKTPSTTFVAAMEVVKKAEEGEISLIEACNIHDKVVIDKSINLLKLINEGHKIKVTTLGGYCQLDEYFNIIAEEIINENQLKNYLTSGQKPKFDLVIDSECVVIENQISISEEVYRLVKNNTYEVICNFKYRTEGWTRNDFYSLFAKAIDNKLKVIVAETSLYDKKQFQLLASVLIELMDNKQHKELLVKILVADKEEMKKLIPKLPENLKLELL